jgi:Protein of unknown function (DUF3352)
MTKAFRVLLLTALLLIPAGCGSSPGGSGSDTAKLAPAGSFFYAEANLDPSGSQEAGMRSILGDLPGTGAPEQRLNDLLEKASKSDKSSKIDYRDDVKPWLGDKASVFVASAKSGSKSSPWAVVIATTDEDKAKDTINKDKGAGDKEATYNGTDYVVESDGDAMAVVDGFFIAGSEAGIKAAVDANKGDSLSESDRYKQAIDGVDDERIALVYEDLSGLVQTLANASGESLGPAAPLLGSLFGGKPVVATIKAEQQALVIDGSLIPGSAVLDLFGKSTPLLGDVPADSWLAIGQSDFGAVVKSLFETFAGFAGGEEQLKAQIRQASGLDLDRDVFSWIGDVAIFVNGDSQESIGGGVLIQSKDEAASRRALTKLSALAAQSGDVTVSAADVGGAKGYKLVNESAPRGVYMLQAGDKVAITYGENAAKQALSGAGDGLTSAPGFTEAAGKLGDAYAPSLYVSVPPILNVADSFGASGSDWEQAKPYLTILDYVIAGSAKSGDEAASRTRIGFKKGV